MKMKNTFTLILALLALVLVGCKTFNPATGENEFDPVKTEQVKAVLKPQVSTVIALLATKHPEARPYMLLAADNICKLRDDGFVSPASFQTAINAALANWENKNSPAVVASVNALIALVEINYANRLRADLPPEEYAWNIFDVFCEGIRQGLEQTAPPQ